MRPKVIVDLKKLENNLNLIRSGLSSGVKIMAVVKDNAYGHGALALAQYLSENVDWFCVARIEEGIALRKQGIEKPILIFEIPPRDRISLYKKYNLTASIPDLSVFDLLEDGTDCHLNFDTGMFRLGILPEDAGLAVEKFRKHKKLNISGIYTHYACSDDIHNPMTDNQLKIFETIRAQFPEDLYTHTANSGAALYYGDSGVHFDGVRSGISLYGYAPGNEIIPGLKPIIELQSNLVQIKKIKKRNPVGYGSSWQAPEDGWLGVIPVGYAHGVPRALSNKIQVEIQGNLYPQAGTISMDFMTVFLGKRKFPTGEEVTILRDGALSADVWAKKLNTISYEIVTNIAGFIDREYRY